MDTDNNNNNNNNKYTYEWTASKLFGSQTCQYLKKINEYGHIVARIYFQSIYSAIVKSDVNSGGGGAAAVVKIPCKLLDQDFLNSLDPANKKTIIECYEATYNKKFDSNFTSEKNTTTTNEKKRSSRINTTRQQNKKQKLDLVNNDKQQQQVPIAQQETTTTTTTTNMEDPFDLFQNINNTNIITTQQQQEETIQQPTTTTSIIYEPQHIVDEIAEPPKLKLGRDQHDASPLLDRYTKVDVNNTSIGSDFIPSSNYAIGIAMEQNDEDVKLYKQCLNMLQPVQFLLTGKKVFISNNVVDRLNEVIKHISDKGKSLEANILAQVKAQNKINNNNNLHQSNLVQNEANIQIQANLASQLKEANDRVVELNKKNAELQSIIDQNEERLKTIVGFLQVSNERRIEDMKKADKAAIIAIANLANQTLVSQKGNSHLNESEAASFDINIQEHQQE